MNVLVTGATGFTGGHLARALAARGHRVTGLVRPARRGSREAAELEAAGVHLAWGDLMDAAAVADASRAVEVAYHIAATYREAGQPDSVYRAINVQGTVHVLEGALAAGARRVVHCSTGGVHGHIERPPATEDAPFAPGDIYQESKLEAEQAARAFGERHGLDVVITRPIGIYGPGDRRFLKMFKGLARGRFPMLGSGNAFYHLTYIDDLVEGFRLAGEVPGAAGRTYILCGARYTRLSELVAIVARTLQVPPPRWHWPVWPFWAAGLMCELVCVPLRIDPPLYRRRVDFYTKSRAFDGTRARTELGFAPAVDLEDGIARTAAWYRAQGWL